ncbi:hypothetical protein SNE40_002957 [Patella caerulea]|uniref:Uncharacterized protein n=1 Tax=Patella caerulea TaxID=87958 RepID=A0AAN8K6W7_PATCE
MANITKEEKMRVLTGMHYENKELLYEEAKKSLKKFKSETILDKSSSSAPEPSIKLEPAFLAENEEALLAAGYTKFRQPNQYGYRRGRGGFRRGFGYNRGYQRERTPITGRSTTPTVSATKKVNATGFDGRILTCSSCGSYRHMLLDCRDSWENMAKVNISEEQEEHAVLFTGKAGFSQLGTEARQCGVLM